MIAAVRFHHEIAQCRTPVDMPRDIPEDRDAPAIGHKFLEKGARNAGSKTKEIVVEPLGRNKNQVAALRLAHQVDCITFAPQFLPLCRARKIRNRSHR